MIVYVKVESKQCVLHLNISHYSLKVCLNHAAVYRIFMFHKCGEIVLLSGVFYDDFCIMKLVALLFTEDAAPLKSLERDKYKHYGFTYSLVRDSFRLQCCRTK